MAKIDADCTEAAKQVWATVMPGYPWPEGWKVVWRRMRGSYGWCRYATKTISLSLTHAERGHEIIDTLIHEFVHMHYQQGVKHGMEFRTIQGRWMARLWGYPKWVMWKGQAYNPLNGRKLTPQSAIEWAKRQVEAEFEAKNNADSVLTPNAA